MIQPEDGILHRLDGRHGGQSRSAQHDDLNSKRSRRRDLAVGRVAAAVLADNEFRAMLLQQRAFFGLGEWAACHNIARIGQHERRLDRIDAAHNIPMLRGGGECRDLLPADCEKHSARSASKRADCVGDVVDLDPSVACERGPRWPSQRQHIGPRSRGGFGRMVRYDGSVGMGCVDQHFDALYGKVGGEAFDAAKSADPHRHRLRAGPGGPAGERQRYAKISAARQPFGQLPRFDRASEYENMPHATC
jgi:hypothetical protein